MRSLRDLISDLGRESLRSKAQSPTLHAAPLVFREIGQRIYTPPAATQKNGLASYEGNPFVHSIVERIASACASQDYYLRRRTGNQKKVAEHPALSFLHSGNELLGCYQCRMLMQAHIDLAGEAFLLIGYDSSGRPASYLPLPPTWVLQCAYDKSERFTIQIPRSGGTIEIPWQDIIWIKKPRPVDPLDRGFSPTRALLTEISLNDEIGVFFYNFIKNRARPDIIVTGTDENPLQKEDAIVMEAAWLQSHGGSSRAGKPLFSNIPLKVTEVGQTVHDSRADEMRKISRDFISEVYGVPPEVFGRVENSNRATADAADYTMAKFVVLPRLKLTTESLYPHLCLRFPDLERYTLHTESPIQEDKEHALNVLRAAPSAFTIDNARAMAGLEPIEGGDAFLKEGTAGVGGTGAGDPNLLADGNTDSPKKFYRHVERISAKAISEDEIDDLVSAIDADEQRNAGALAAILSAAAVRAGGMITAVRGFDADIDAQLTAWAVERAAELAPLLDATTADEVSGAIRTTDGSSAAITMAVLALVSSWSSSRSQLIGASEANGALSIAEMLVGKETGTTKKVWLTQGDERVRALHKPMNGQVVDLAANFTAPNGETGPGPGRFKSAAMNAGCRCGSVAFKGDPPSAGGMVSLLAEHEARLKTLETDLAIGVAGYFAAQAAAILAKLGSMKRD